MRNTIISPLTQLALDEQSVDQRKLNIQRFGAAWIRPPGMSKTLQGEIDEKAEHEESEHQQIMDEVDIVGDGPLDADEDGDARQPIEDLDADIPIAGSDRDDSIPEGESFADASDEGRDTGLDLDADIPEAETETLWDDSDIVSEDDDEEYHSEGQTTNAGTVITEESHNMGDFEESPQQAAFSHDEAWLEPVQTHTPGYDWRARRRYRTDLDYMDVDE